MAGMLNLARGDGAPPGADEFFPVLVYVVIRCNPPNLHANLQFISRFRCPSRMMTELAYCYTHMVAVGYFLDSIDSSSISISKEEYEQYALSLWSLISKHHV
jgi:Rab5 GDP/GTP exchange factor